MFLVKTRVTDYLMVAGMDPSYTGRCSVFILYTGWDSATLTGFVINVEQLMFFLCLLVPLSSQVRFIRLICSFLDYQDIISFCSFVVDIYIDVRSWFAVDGTLMSDDGPIHTQVGYTSHLLLTSDVTGYMEKGGTVRFVLRIGKMAKTFDSHVTAMGTFAMVSDHHINLWK